MLIALAMLGAASAQVVDRIAAIVDEDVVLLSDVYDMGAEFIEQSCPRQLQRARCVYDAELQVLDALIRRSLMKRELDRLQQPVTAADVDRTIESIVRDYGLPDRDALRAEVQAAGVSWEAYRQQLRDTLMAQTFQQRVLAPRVTVGEDELRDLYDRTAREGTAPAVRLQALGIVLPPDGAARDKVLEQAAALAERLRAGELDFETAQADYDGARLAAAIGDKLYEAGELAPVLDEQVFAVEPGEVIGPVPLGNLVALVRVAERATVQTEVKPFDEVADALRNQMFQRRVQEAEDEWYQRTRREVAVTVRLPEPS